MTNVGTVAVPSTPGPDRVQYPRRPRASPALPGWLRLRWSTLLRVADSPWVQISVDLPPDFPMLGLAVRIRVLSGGEKRQEIRLTSLAK